MIDRQRISHHGNFYTSIRTKQELLDLTSSVTTQRTCHSTTLNVCETPEFSFRTSGEVPMVILDGTGIELIEKEVGT